MSDTEIALVDESPIVEIGDIAIQVVEESLIAQVSSDNIEVDQVEEIVVIVGEQGPAGISGGFYEHIQAIPLATWVISHNLGYKPNVQIEDSANESVIPNRIEHASTTQMIVYFSGSMSGRAYLS